MTQPLPALPMVLRESREGDLPFIVSTWVQSLGVQPWMPRTAYLTNMRKSAMATLGRARVVVLASNDHDATILGWACGDTGVVHHAYFRPELLASPAGREWVDAVVGAAKVGK